MSNTPIRPATIPKVRTVATDRATGVEGMITHVLIEMDGSVSCLLQPRTINPETGHPNEGIWCSVNRLQGLQMVPLPPEVPFEALGTQITDQASGMTGMAVGFLIHPNGCLHVHIQPAGVIEKTGSRIRPYDVDLRCCVGEKLPILTEEVKAARPPSPSPVDGCPTMR